ncbi:ATP-dependent DNA helicase [Verrucomicrobium sp. BvORR106]|uniref:ATP-dependent DNA helicase n=1 Tax=Verrucomicrobium sp. BvORR106 TaxID=1403819 RepID=UPI00068F1B9F|nr:ATP-dependent DNA helicase [Verrucomicrobium sp. BvORR106]
MIHIASDAESAAQPTLAERMAQAFSPDGILAKSPDFEYRKQQQRMAKIVGKALETTRPVVIEAATGVGKSLAYLLPSVTFAMEKKRKAIITTHTINLQEQLIHKDLPIVQKIIGTPFKSELLKGRGNYLCPQRLERAFQGTPDLFTTSEQAELKLIWEWSQKTLDGSLSDLDFTPSPKVWSQICSESYICTPRRCGQTRCFYQAVRKRMAEADVLVMNHSLFFMLLSSTEDVLPEDANFLYPKDFLIVDEAHTIENVAARAFGLHLSESSIRFELQRLFNPRTKKGQFPHQGDAVGCRAVTEALDAMEMFFRAVEGSSHFMNQQSREFRVRETGLVDNTIALPLHRVIERTKIAGDAAKNETSRLEFQDLTRRLASVQAGMTAFLDQTEDDHVYWVERSGGDNRAVSLHSAPIDVSPQLSKLFFQGDKACILTSATLGVGEAEDLSYFRQRVGATSTVAVNIASPFDFEKQMRLYLVKSMPAPGTKEHEAALPKWIEHFLDLSQGRAFVLFTSYTQMTRIAEQMEEFCEDRGWTLLVQGRNLPRHQLLAEFRRDTHSILFGTESFWTGVDVPGEALSNVIITKLPFAVPDHPLTAARLEHIEESGGNPFTEYSVPEAILKLRQGVGRLIRTKKDQGICAILDNRVLTKPYGRAFLKALPPCPVEIIS